MLAVVTSQLVLRNRRCLGGHGGGGSPSARRIAFALVKRAGAAPLSLFPFRATPLMQAKAAPEPATKANTAGHRDFCDAPITVYEPTTGKITPTLNQQPFASDSRFWIASLPNCNQGNRGRRTERTASPTTVGRSSTSPIATSVALPTSFCAAGTAPQRSRRTSKPGFGRGHPTLTRRRQITVSVLESNRPSFARNPLSSYRGMPGPFQYFRPPGRPVPKFQTLDGPERSGVQR
jgi:hypothetical protein